MRLSVVATAALAACGASVVQGFYNTSPFILFSTAPKYVVEDVSVASINDSIYYRSLNSSLTPPSRSVPPAAGTPQLQSSSRVVDTAKAFLSSCPSRRYLLVAQPNLNAAHLASSKAVPKLRQALQRDAVLTRLSVAEVAGEVDLEDLAAHISDACKDKDKSPSVQKFALSAVPRLGAKQVVQENDGSLGVVLDQYAMEGDYTVVYAAGSSPEAAAGPATQYEPEFTHDTHMELKRQLGEVGRRAHNSTRSLPLFEKYQFFTPGIFMGLVALLILLSILAVGLSALNSLKVSYGAFDKDMGPAAQKKLQ